MTPTFSFTGGKAKLRKWLLHFFPRKGGRYIELFAGRANVFFLACQHLHFDRWELYDKDVRFLKALQVVDCSKFPDSVEKHEYSEWTARTDPVARVLEPVLSFFGKGYDSTTGFQEKMYKYGPYRDKCERSQVLLYSTVIQEQLWDSFAFDSLTPDDFIYCDPPYYRTDGSHYDNIDHFNLCRVLNKLPCRWALSGYANMLYERNLNFKFVTRSDRTAEMKRARQGFGASVTETLWTNYHL